ncbi:MAG: SCO family protein [Acidobacteriota bacterium]
MILRSHRRPGERAHRVAGVLVVLLVAVSVLAPTAWAQRAPGQSGLVEPEDMPGPLKEVRIDQKLGAQLPLDARFIDENGREVMLGDYFDGRRPVILAFVYYECPMLCSLILNGTASALGVLSFDPGDQYDVVAISIDPEETPEMARETERKTLHRFGRPETADGWHFLLGDEETVSQVAAIAGFGYEYIPATDEWAHASGIMVVTPSGQISQYYYGIEYPPKDLRLAIVDASQDTIGNLVDQILLYCYRYDPQIGKYTAVAMRMVRLAGIAFVVGLSVFLWFMLRSDRRDASGPTSTLGAA